MSIPIKNGANRQPDGTFGPGNVANPNGRPKGAVSVVDALKRELEKVADIKGNEKKRTYLELLIQRILDKSIADGDVAMIRDIINRIDGMPKQPVEMSGSIDTRLEVLTRMGLVDDTEIKRIEGQTSQDTRD